MALTTKIEPINRDIELMLSESLSSSELAEYAAGAIEEVKKYDAAILGRIPRTTITVDGHIDESLSSVRSNSVIVAKFEAGITDTLIWISEQLIAHSPVRSGRYQKSHTLFADQKEVPIGDTIPEASQYVFVSNLPYSAKIERGMSSQAPQGVYQVVAMLAQQRPGNTAKIEFTYRGLIGLSSGTGTLINPLWDPTRRRKKGQGTKAYNKRDVRFPVIVVHVGS